MSFRRTAMVILAVATVSASLLIGAGDFSPGDVCRAAWRFLAGEQLSERDQFIGTVVMTLRVPRVFTAALVGSALAAAGVLSQGLFRNPLADPSILGATSGASFGAAMVFYFGSAMAVWWAVPVAAFAGAMMALMLVVFGLERFSRWSLESLLLAGFALNALLSAMTSLIISLSLEDYLRAPAMLHWMLGSLGAKPPEFIGAALIPVVLGGFVGLLVAHRLDVMTLGDDVARSLSVDVPSLRRTTIVAVSLLVGSAVCLAGAIPFVGLIVPHWTRLCLTPRHRPLLGWSALNGMSLLLVADMVSRTVRAPQEVQVGVVIALLGAPVFLGLLVTRQQREGVA